MTKPPGNREPPPRNEYRIEAIAGTLFLMFGGLTVAVNSGEEDQVPDVVREHFEYLAAAGNEKQVRGEPPPGDRLDPPREPV